MLNVSREFQNAIRNDVRNIKAKIQIDWTDPFLDQTIVISANENSYNSFPEQVADNIENIPRKYASLDGSWILDGSYYLCPDTQDAADDNQMGWWGSSLSASDQTFVSPFPTLTVAFQARPIRSLKVVGDDARQEYPVDFNIYCYDGSGNVLHQENVIDNAAVKWEKDITNILNVEKVELEITKWSHANRQVKITEFFTSIQETYYDDDILLINLLEERAVSDGSLPIGNISSNEIDIRLNNISNRYNAGNTKSELYQLVKTNRRIKAWIGPELPDGTVEYVPLGTFWSGDWDVPGREVYAGTSGRDRLELLRESEYSVSQVKQNISLYDLAIDILQDAGVDTENYFVDSELQNTIIPYAWFDSTKHKKALRDIALASLGQVFASRNDVIRIEGPSYIQKQTTSETYFVQGAAFPANAETTDAFGIGRDDYRSKSQPSNSGSIANYIIVDTQPLQPISAAKEVYRSNSAESITAGATKKITAFYNSTPVMEDSAALEKNTTDTSITSVNYYAWGAEIEITNAGSTDDTFELVISGKPLEIKNKERAIAKDNESIQENGKLTYKFPLHHLVQTKEQAQQVADTLLASFKDARRDVTINWRGNPALELADVITVPDYQNLEQNIDERGIFYSTRQNIEYDGTLNANLEGRRM